MCSPGFDLHVGTQFQELEDVADGFGHGRPGLAVEVEGPAVHHTDVDLDVRLELRDEVQRRVLLNARVVERGPLAQWLAREDELCRLGGDALLLLDRRLELSEGEARVHGDLEGAPRVEALDVDLHVDHLEVGLASSVRRRRFVQPTHSARTM